MAETLTNNVNALQREGAPQLVVPARDEELFYKPPEREDAVLSDVLGRTETAKLLRDKLGVNHATPFDECKQYVYEHFRSGEIPESHKTFLSAPNEEVWTGN